jgi:RNA polymerase sigma-70 factor (ECF subfamily)
MFYAYGMSICIRYSGNRDEAVEILNEAFMKVFQNLGKFNIGRPFKPWFRRITINTAINFLKKKAPESAEISIGHGEHLSRGEEILSGISYDEIVDMIQQLPPSYRTVFNLYVIEGYKHDEIASMLGISTGTSKSNLSKAKQQLRGLLQAYFEEDYERQK